MRDLFSRESERLWSAEKLRSAAPWRDSSRGLDFFGNVFLFADFFADVPALIARPVFPRVGVAVVRRGTAFRGSVVGLFMYRFDL